MRSSTRARRAKRRTPTADSILPMIGVVDIGGTKIAAGVVDEAGALHDRREAPTGGFADSVRAVVAMLGTRKLEGIAIASTGPIDRESGIFGQVDTLPGWKGSDIRTPLVSTFDVPIVIENDADAAALGEATAFDAKRFLYITISTGIGAGIVLDGRIYRGVDGAHPEIGHHMIEASGPPCSCGGRGCWEILASGTAMARAAKRPDVTAETICASAGEAWADAIIEQEAFYLGVGLANVISMFTPDVIALGGGVMKSAHLFLDRARAVVRERCTMVPSERTAIVLGKLGANAGLLGAARAFRERGLP